MQPLKAEIEPIWGVPYTLYRYDRSDDDRYYFRYEGDTRHSYLSVTSFIGHSLGISKILANWMATKGKDFAQAYSRYRADYGTQMHIEIVEILRTGGGSFDEISKRQYKTARELGYGSRAMDWVHEIRRDILAFLKFVKDKNVEIVFAELPVYSDEFGVAGSIDIGAVMDFNGSRVNCLIDLKSGKKGFFEGHNFQLNIYKELWNKLFSDQFPVTHVFNWAPNDWRGSKKDVEEWPTYKLQNQSYTKYAILERLALAKKEGWILPPDGHMEIKGAFILDDFEIGKHIINYGLEASSDGSDFGEEFEDTGEELIELGE